MFLKTWFLLLYLFSSAELELIYFIQLISQDQTVARDFKMLFEFINAMNIKIIGF